MPTIHYIRPSNHLLQCIGAVFPKQRLVSEEDIPLDSLPIVKEACEDRDYALAYSTEDPDKAMFHGNDILLFYAPKVYSLRYLSNTVDTFFFDHCTTCERRNTSLCLVDPSRYGNGVCPRGLYPENKSTRIQSPWPTMVVHLCPMSEGSLSVKLYTPLEHSDNMEYMAFKTLYTGHTDEYGSMCLGDALTSAQLFSSARDMRYYTVADYLSAWLSAQFKPFELRIPSKLTLLDWLSHLSTEQAKANVATKKEGSFSQDIHVFKVNPDSMFYSMGGDPLISIHTDRGTGRYIVATNSESKLIEA